MKTDAVRGCRLMVVCLTGMAASVVIPGCSTPFDSTKEQELHRSVVDALRKELTYAKAQPEAHTLSRKGESLPINKAFLPELEAMAGPSSHDLESLDFGPDLTMQTSPVVPISIEHAIRSAVNNNLQVQFARLTPAINESDVVTAEAAFDWVFSSNLSYNNQDQINPSSAFNVSTGFSKRQEVRNTTGIRKPLESGGQFSIQQQYTYTDFETSGLNFNPDPATQGAITLQLDQPLLRNFGSDIALAQIRINRNTERDGIAKLRDQLIKTTNQTEQAYWNLVRAHHDLAILEKLLERGIKTRDHLQARVDAKLDVPPSQLSDAVARVERRKNDVMRARNAVRDASDQLKVLINDPNMPIGDEVLLLPVDHVVDEPVTFSLLDSLTTALKHRPEIDQAILSIDNTSIRQTVAANQRLPQLDLQLQTRFNGLDDKLDVYDEMFDGKFIDYVVSLTFEQPIGNRAAEAGYVKRNLERQQAILSYRNTVQQIVRDVKSALRRVQLNYQVIEQARMSRLAAADSLRSLEVENQLLQAMSSERLELEFNRQEALSNAERVEIQAMTDYDIAVAQLQAAMGVSLEYNGIELVVPNPGDELPARASTSWTDELRQAAARRKAKEQAKKQEKAEEQAQHDQQQIPGQGQTDIQTQALENNATKQAAPADEPGNPEADEPSKPETDDEAGDTLEPNENLWQDEPSANHEGSDDRADSADETDNTSDQ